jgi:hypothetical protein
LRQTPLLASPRRTHFRKQSAAKVGSHTPPEDRQATCEARHLSGAGREYIRQRRNTRWVSRVLRDLLTFNPKCAILYSLHESHNFHKECAFLLMVKMHTPFSAFSYESSEDLCSNNWRCVFRALQLGRTFYFQTLILFRGS